MNLTFIETSEFTEAVEEYFGSDQGYSQFQRNLLNDPAAGDVISGCGGLRKVRWADPRRGKGKRGGLRIIYLYVPAARAVAFVDMYDKDETADLTAEDRKEFAATAERIRKNLIERAERGLL